MTPSPTGPNRIRYWENVLAAVTAVVERYAPGAPSAIKNEAAIRVGGYLQVQPMAAIPQESLGNRQVSVNTAQISAQRHSGAMALLSPYRVRRAL